MSADLIYPDFAGKTKHYTKRKPDEEPIIYLTESEVDAIGLFIAEAALNPTRDQILNCDKDPT